MKFRAVHDDMANIALGREKLEQEWRKFAESDSGHSSTDYRVTLVVEYLGWVDLYLGSYFSCTVDTFCQCYP